MTRSDLKYYVEEIQPHKFYTQLNKKGEKLYLFETNNGVEPPQQLNLERLDKGLNAGRGGTIDNIRRIRACVIDVAGAVVSYTDWYRSFDQLNLLLESLNLDINDLVEVDKVVSVVEDGSNMEPNHMRKHR